MAAQFVDALKGYEYFLRFRGKASMDAINEYLLSQGRRPISQRTYGHYRKLIANGFRSYIPINKFDVFQSLGRLQMAADRRRNRRELSTLNVQISRNREKWVDCVIVDKSIVGFGIETKGRFPSTPGRQIWVRIMGYHDIPAILVWRQHNEHSTRVGIRALEFIAKYQISDERIDLERLRGVLRISHDIEGALVWNVIHRVIDKTDELLDAVTAFIYTIGELLESDIRLARSVLLSIKFGSAGDAQIKIDFGIAEILRLILEKIQFWKVEKRKFRAEARKLELEVANLEIETIRNAVNLKKELKDPEIVEDIKVELPETLKRVFGVNKLPSGLLDDGSLECAILMERILPPITELIAGDDTDFDVAVSIEES